MHKLIIESLATKKGNVFEGIALTPSVSLNHNIYSAEEIDAAKNIGVPLPADMEHDRSQIVGEVIYHHIPETHSLGYRATVKDESVAAQLADGTYKVSIEAGVEEVAKSCNKKGCYNLITGLTMEGIGFTRTPGVTTTTLHLTESFDWEKINGVCVNCSHVEENTDELKKEIDTLRAEIQSMKTPKCDKCGKIKK